MGIGSILVMGGGSRGMADWLFGEEDLEQKYVVVKGNISLE